MTDTRRPDEDCHNVSSADPALVFPTRKYLPLASSRHDVLVAQLPLDDAYHLIETIGAG